MTPEEVRSALAGIRLHAYDPEVAHGMEDDLRRDVLQSIAESCADPAELARLALTSSDIGFPRWCA